MQVCTVYGYACVSTETTLFLYKTNTYKIWCFYLHTFIVFYYRIRLYDDYDDVDVYSVITVVLRCYNNKSYARVVHAKVFCFVHI